MNYFITAIGTDSGKTMISSALSLAIGADYWKPIQAGFPTDTNTVKNLTDNQVTCHEEQYILKTPASPHQAAKMDGIELSLRKFTRPKTNHNLVIEGAGGCMVPINNHEFMIDLVPKFGAEIILVSNLYLGSINHTILTLELIKQRGYTLKAIIFNGPSNSATEDIIMKNTSAPCLIKIPQMDQVNQKSIYTLSQNIKKNWNELGW
ncbi:MAG TPA: dethiobiotin synthase [Fulvivirga sp.]|nr:dethiobiotin synthase [Fulvivirga sp.]